MSGTRTVASQATAADVQEHTQQLEGRVTGLERDMQHTLQMVEQTNRTVEAGFAETRRMFKDSDERASSRASELHQRIDKQQQTVAQTGKISWPLVISSIVVSIVIGSMFVAFVNMSLAPIAKDMVETRQESAQLQAISAACALDRRDLGRELTKVQTQLVAVEKQQDLCLAEMLRGAVVRSAQQCLACAMRQQAEANAAAAGTP